MAKDTDDTSTPSKVDEEAQYPDNETPTKNKRDKRQLVPKHSKDDQDDDADDWRGGSDYPPSWTMYEKASKEVAAFRVGGPFHRCGLCSYYSGNSCKIVRGYVSPNMSCRFFQKKYEAADYSKVTMRINRR